MKYYGYFIEKSRESFLLNIFPKDDLLKYENLIGSGPNIIDYNIQNLYTPYLKISEKENVVKKLFNGNTLNFYSNNWVELSLNKNEKGNSKLFDDATSSESHKCEILSLKLIAGVNSESKKLKSIFSLDHIEESSEETIIKVFENLKGEFLATYNVGQGSCSAACDKDGMPLVYFDIGGGSIANANSYPKDLSLCSCSIPPIVLSHWHVDHWISALKTKKFMNSVWLVPNQNLSADALKIALQLKLKGKLLVYPSHVNKINVDGGTIFKCTGTSQNDSGLAFLSNTGDYLTLLPGDAKYIFLPISHSINNLVVSHHGGANQTVPPQKKPSPNCHIYSYGINNTYNHPLPQTVSLHSNYWRNRIDTISGSIGFSIGFMTNKRISSLYLFNIMNTHAFNFCSSHHSTIEQFSS